MVPLANPNPNPNPNPSPTVAPATAASRPRPAGPGRRVPHAATTDLLRRVAALAWSATVTFAAALGGAAQAADGRLAPVDGARLAQAMRDGGLVLYFRHTRTHRDQVGAEREAMRSGRFSIERCDTQRNLDETGLREADRQAAALAALRVAQGPVGASRFCRARQHAERTAGRVDAWHDALTPPRDAAKVAELRRMLARVPERGTNLWYFAHGGVLWGATNYDSVESETFVFRPDGAGATLVATIRIDEWDALLAGRACCAPRDYWDGRSTPPE